MPIAVIVIAVGCIPTLAAAFSLSNQVVAWCCVALSAMGLILLIVDGRRQRRRKDEAEPSG
jgi:threonine/homoserine efflux transporter RhtA